jgi:predicted peroxiredoxin
MMPGGVKILKNQASIYWKFLVDKGASILVCKPCAETRMLGEDELPPGAKIDTGVTLIDLADQSKVFTF